MNFGFDGAFLLYLIWFEKGLFDWNSVMKQACFPTVAKPFRLELIQGFGSTVWYQAFLAKEDSCYELYRARSISSKAAKSDSAPKISRLASRSSEKRSPPKSRLIFFAPFALCPSCCESWCSAAVSFRSSIFQTISQSGSLLSWFCPESGFGEKLKETRAAIHSYVAARRFRRHATPIERRTRWVEPCAVCPGSVIDIISRVLLVGLVFLCERAAYLVWSMLPFFGAVCQDYVMGGSNDTSKGNRQKQTNQNVAIYGYWEKIGWNPFFYEWQ